MYQFSYLFLYGYCYYEKPAIHRCFGLPCTNAHVHAPKYCVQPLNWSIFTYYLGDQTLRSLLLWETGRAHTFLASVRACTLWTFSNFVCNLRIGSSSFSILLTKLSECSFYEKRAVHARFGLACTLQIFSNFTCNLRIGPSSFSNLF